MMDPLKVTFLRILNFCHIILAILWIYQGLIPKVIFQVEIERFFWQQLHFPTLYIPSLIILSGMIEMIFGSLFLFFKHQYLHYLNILSLAGLFIAVLCIYPAQLYQAFNPVVMNMALASLSIISIWCLNILYPAKHEPHALHEYNKTDSPA